MRGRWCGRCGAPSGFAERLDCLNDVVTAYLQRNPEAAGLIIRELSGPSDDRPGTRRAGDTLRFIKELLEGGLAQGTRPAGDTGHLLMSIMGVHLLYFALPGIGEAVVGHEVFAAGAGEERAAEVRRQVRALCGLPSTQEKA